MSYNKGQGQFGKGNIWAMLRQLLEGQGSINPSMQSGAGSLQVLKATYDFAVDGGAIGTILLAASKIVPTGAIILGGIIDPITLPTSGGAATIAVGLGSGANAAGLKAAAAFGTYIPGTPLAVLPVWSAGFFETAADQKISVTIAGATVTAGKFAVHIVYVMSGE